jgi:hypothetical protein
MSCSSNNHYIKMTMIKEPSSIDQENLRICNKNMRNFVSRHFQ